jgi:hypothetical protein
MPKDPTKNVDRYKIKGGHLNEFDFTQRQEEFAEKQPPRDAKLIPGTPPEEKDEGLKPVVKKSTKKSGSKPPTRKAAKK